MPLLKPLFILRILIQERFLLVVSERLPPRLRLRVQVRFLAHRAYTVASSCRGVVVRRTMAS